MKAIREFQGVNASVDGDKILIHHAIHLGMAAARLQPFDCAGDQTRGPIQPPGLARQVNDLAGRARAGKLTLTTLPEEPTR